MYVNYAAQLLQISEVCFIRFKSGLMALDVYICSRCSSAHRQVEISHQVVHVLDTNTESQERGR
jgi:hypothetical protein